MRILVGLDRGGGALGYAASLAERERGHLTLLSAVMPPPVTTWLSQQLPEDPWRTAEESAATVLRAAVDALPDDLGVTTLLGRGGLARALATELRRERYDLVVIVARSSRRAQRAVNRAHVPAVLVPVGEVSAMADAKGRVVFLIDLKPGSEAAFLEAYERIRRDVAQGVPGHLVDQVCRMRDDGDSWLITSEWQTLEHFVTWERSDEHRTLAAPLRACIAQARSLKFDVIEETSTC